jgi:hypothetical protein
MDWRLHIDCSPPTPPTHTHLAGVATEEEAVGVSHHPQGEQQLGLCEVLQPAESSAVTLGAYREEKHPASSDITYSSRQCAGPQTAAAARLRLWPWLRLWPCSAGG